MKGFEDVRTSRESAQEACKSLSTGRCRVSSQQVRGVMET